MMLLVSAFIAGMLLLIAAARMEDSDELGDDAERMQWIDYLARRSLRRERRRRSRYSMSGWGKGRGCRG